jgi:hypothetical protein
MGNGCRWDGVDCSNCDLSEGIPDCFQSTIVTCKTCGRTKDYWADCLCDVID